jgi:hypothetical protein
MEVGQAALEEPLLRPGLGQLERACVGGAGLAVAAEASQRVGACGVVVAVGLEIETVEQGKGCLRRQPSVRPRARRSSPGRRRASGTPLSKG